MCVDYKNVYLIGDMNAHTGYKADFIEADQFLADYFDFDSELLNYFNKSEMLINTKCPKIEQIKIAHLTQKVENLLKSVNQITFFILNGRCGNDKGIGKCTFRGTTLIDYAISSTAGLSYIKNFEVEDTDILFSDGHSLLSIYLTLPCQQKQTENTHIGSKAGPRLWDESNTDTFLNNIDVGNIHIIEEALDTMRTTTNAITTEDLNSIVVQISNLLMQRKSHSKLVRHIYRNQTLTNPGLVLSVKMPGMHITRPNLATKNLLL